MSPLIGLIAERSFWMLAAIACAGAVQPRMSPSTAPLAVRAVLGAAGGSFALVAAIAMTPQGIVAIAVLFFGTIAAGRSRNPKEGFGDRIRFVAAVVLVGVCTGAALRGAPGWAFIVGGVLAFLAGRRSRGSQDRRGFAVTAIAAGVCLLATLGGEPEAPRSNPPASNTAPAAPLALVAPFIIVMAAGFAIAVRKDRNESVH